MLKPDRDRYYAGLLVVGAVVLVCAVLAVLNWDRARKAEQCGAWTKVLGSDGSVTYMTVCEGYAKPGPHP